MSVGQEVLEEDVMGQSNPEQDPPDCLVLANLAYVLSRSVVSASL